MAPQRRNQRMNRPVSGPLPNTRLMAGWLALACLAPLNARAAVAESDFDKLMALSLTELIETPIITASRQSETRDQTPSHIIVVTREQIRERRYKNLADLLEDMPGVDFQRGTKSSQYNQFAVQGSLGPHRLVVMLDGVRIGHPSGGNMPIAENLALYHAKQVEFLYGPAAALYGADAVSGVINIITDRGSRGAGSWVEVGAGDFDTQETSFMAGYSGERMAFTVGGHRQRSDRAPLDRYYPNDFRKVDADPDSQRVVPAAEREGYVGDISSNSLFARLDLGDDLTFGFYRNVFRSLTSTGDPPATALYLRDSQWTTTSETTYGKYRYTLGADFSGEVVVDYSRMQVDPHSKYNNSFSNFSDGYSYVLGERIGIEHNINWRFDDTHRVQAGLGYQKHYAIETASLPAPYDTDRGKSEQGYVYPNTTIPMQIYDAAFENVSMYAQLQSEWDEAFSTMVGLRMDRHSDYGQTVNPRLGAVWRVNPQHVLKFLYGEAFRAPSPEESLSAFGIFDGSMSNGLYVGRGFRVPNFNLDPEEARTTSLTWDWRPQANLNFVANLYHSRIENLIVTRPSTQVDAIPGAVLINPETKGNAGVQRHYGLDLMAQWRFKIDEAWSGDLWGSASWIRGRIDEGDGVEWEISHVAERKLKLGTTLRYRDRLSLTTQVLAMGDTTNGRRRAPAPSLQLAQTCDADGAPERCRTDGYTVVNFHAGWHKLFDGRATLWLDIYNLFDTRYYAAHGSGSRTFWDMPQQPRTSMISLEYRF